MSLKKMTLRKINIDYSVKYVSKNNHSHSGETKPISKMRKKNASKNKLSQKTKVQ